MKRAIRVIESTAPVVLLGALVSCSGSDTPSAVDADVALDIGETEELYVVGSASTDVSAFGRIAAVTFDDAGNLYVLDAHNHRVVVFDSAGSVIRAFGREGEGPGELSSPGEIVVTPNGSIVVSDGGNRALIVFDSSGEHRFNVPFDDLAPPTNDGIVAIDDTTAVALTRGSRRSSGRIAHVVRVPLHAGGAYAPLDSIRLVEWLTFEIPASASTPAMTLMRSPVYSPELFLAHLAGDVVAAHYDTEYRIRLYDLTTGEQREITRAVPSLAVGSAVREQWHARLDSTRRAAGFTDPLGYDVPFADRMAVISRMRSDPSGGLWVQRHMPDGLPDGPIDLFAAGGAYVGTLSPRVLPSAIGHQGQAAYIVVDSLGVERVSVRTTGVDWQSPPPSPAAVGQVSH